MNNYENGFFNLKNKAIVELKPHLFRMYAYLISKDFTGNGIFHSQETMAKELGVCVRTVQRHLKALKELGYITFRRRGFNQTNIYNMLKDIVAKVKEKKEEMTNNFKKAFNNEKPKLRFNNFEGRKRTKQEWNSLEKQLLGWE